MTLYPLSEVEKETIRRLANYKSKRFEPNLALWNQSGRKNPKYEDILVLSKKLVPENGWLIAKAIEYDFENNSEKPILKNKQTDVLKYQLWKDKRILEKPRILRYKRGKRATKTSSLAVYKLKQDERTSQFVLEAFGNDVDGFRNSDFFNDLNDKYKSVLNHIQRILDSYNVTYTVYEELLRDPSDVEEYEILEQKKIRVEDLYIPRSFFMAIFNKRILDVENKDTYETGYNYSRYISCHAHYPPSPLDVLIDFLKVELFRTTFKKVRDKIVLSLNYLKDYQVKALNEYNDAIEETTNNPSKDYWDIMNPIMEKKIGIEMDWIKLHAKLDGNNYYNGNIKKKEKNKVGTKVQKNGASTVPLTCEPNFPQYIYPNLNGKFSEVFKYA
jgi:hypothetical protein